MCRRPVCLAWAAFALSSGALFAGPPDGMELFVDPGPAPGSVSLQWTGGQPDFTVYRSTDKTQIVQPANQIAVTPVRAYDDTPPPGAAFFYEITSPCVYAPPEVCDGVDNDCNGEFDDNPVDIGAACDGADSDLCLEGATVCANGSLLCNDATGSNLDVCNGLDDDCDPSSPDGSEAPCVLPNAQSACVAGSCAIAACDTGFGDCDTSPANGCESDLHVAQSTSPAAIWAGTPRPDRDLKPGYLRVQAIANCGACGQTCDDGVACTTDLCIPVQPPDSPVAVCGHFDRAQTAEARCGGLTLPPGTPVPRDAACTGPDTDGDGLHDAWETGQTDPYTGGSMPAGVDLDCDGEISDADGDLVYHEPPGGPTVPDVYVQYDYMQPGAGEQETHAPVEFAVEAVRAAFAGRGIALHVDPVHQPLPHAQVIYFPVMPNDACATGDAVSFDALKAGHFDPRRKYAYRYFVFSHDSCSGGTSGNSGISEIKGNDAIVSLGGLDYAGTAEQVATKKMHEQSGTILHEIGHTLGLDHGGPAGPCDPSPCPGDQQPRKPNHLSVMDYRYQLAGIYRSANLGTPLPLDPEDGWRVDFSHFTLGTLDEANLNEIAGIGGAPPPFDRDIALHDCVGNGPRLAPVQGPVDWTCNGVFSPGVTADINSDLLLTALAGADDWGNLDFDFQCEPTFEDGGFVFHTSITPAELTKPEADARRLRAFLLCQSNAECDDGNFCNGAETCTIATGACQAGTPPSCDDSNPCTIDTCSAATNACLNDPAAANGTPCSSGLFCVVGTTCSNGTCGGGAPRDCDDGLACTQESCDEAQQACVATCTTAACWTAPVGAGVASAPACDSEFQPPGGGSRSYLAKGNALYAFRNTSDASGPAGSPVWTWAPQSGATLTNFPAPVPLSQGAGGGSYLFVGGDDGFLYKVRTSDGAQTAARDTRRSSCAGDGIVATPAVVLYRFASPSFQNEVDAHPGHAGDDLVIVITRTACGDATSNRVLAYWASDLTTKWVFNDPPTHWMDFGTEGCTVDYDSNRLYCGTNQPAGHNQNTLWALDASSAAVIWSHNAGSLSNRPMLNTSTGRLYVAYQSGAIMAYDPAGNGAGGALPLWTAPAMMPGTIARSPWVETRGGPWQDKILVLDTLGYFRRFSDLGPEARMDWSVAAPAGSRFVSMAAIDPARGKAYIGRDDGTLQMIELSTAGTDGVVPVPPNFGLVREPALCTVNGVTPGFNRVTVAAGDVTGVLTQFCAPLPSPPGACSSNADCASLGDACNAGVCDLTSHACYRQPIAEGASCNGGGGCGQSTVCSAGRCVATVFAGCPCVQSGDQACAAGQTCCASPAGGGSCTDVDTDGLNCGACGNVCAPGWTCSEGICGVAPAACAIPTAATLNGAASLVPGTNGVAFDVTAAVCSAYVSTYRFPTASPVQRIDPLGNVGTLNPTGPVQAPFHGLAVPREGDGVFAAMLNRPPGSVPQTTPGLAAGSFSSATLPAVLTTNPTSATTPFSNANFDQGPVGPAIDLDAYTASGGGEVRLYVGNWAANGDVYALRRQCAACAWTATQLPIAITPVGDRITAIAFEKNPGPAQHRFLIVAHGTTLSVVNLDTALQNDLDLALAAPAPAPISVLSLDVHPQYGDIYAEVRDTAARRRILVVREDRSVRELGDVQGDLRVLPLAPATFPTDGRLVIMPDGQLLRLIPGTGAIPPQFQIYRLPH